MPLAASGVTHQGRRSTNEDAWLVDLNLGLLVVADGMGGHNAGEVASAMAVRAISDYLGATHEPREHAVLEQAIRLANDRILTAASRQPDHAGMGTTVVAALVGEDRAVYMSVGDSRVYLWQGGRLTQLTRDDSWLVAALDGDGAADRLGAHPMRHVLTKVVGLRPDLQATAAECPLGAGDSLLLCSDGVHGAVPFDMLAEIMSSGDAVAAVADRVVLSAIAQGATDNATAVVARIGAS
jgi:protein phosphatase